jgi:hypothetical protein
MQTENLAQRPRTRMWTVHAATDEVARKGTRACMSARGRDATGLYATGLYATPVRLSLRRMYKSEELLQPESFSAFYGNQQAQLYRYRPVPTDGSSLGVQQEG